MAYLDETGLTHLVSLLKDSIDEVSARIPVAPVTNGKYKLLANVVSGTPTYEWDGPYTEVACEVLSVPDDAVDIWVGTPYQLQTPAVSPSDTTDAVRYKANDLDLLNVSSTGAVSGYAPGNGIVTVMCGQLQHQIDVAISQEVPASAGIVIGWGDAQARGRIAYFNNGDTFLGLALFDYPIKQGQTVHITLSRSSGYTFQKLYILAGDPVEMTGHSTAYQWGGLDIVDTGPTWTDANYSRTATNAVEYVFGTVTFIGGYNGRSNTGDSITAEDVATFLASGALRIWITPEATE